MTNQNTPLKTGEKITYDKEIMFKGTERITSTIVARKKVGYLITILVETGDEITIDTRQELS